ncbi:M48 family metallopeptidase [Paracoccus luteus]|uniref:M48 family metallopeptidase n=1 Tax=Paracoccus luteus TaxID=2508543 RepID=UPI001FE30B13|nr:SprT family zinc-dependent metalloprotease [Paracoccus luteus]
MGGMDGQGTDVVVAAGIAVAVRRSARARRITLRVSRADHAVTLTLPARLPQAEGLAFLRAREGWLRRALDALPPPALVVAGAIVPVGGEGLAVTPAAVRAPRVAAGALLVPSGRPPGASVEAFLKHSARADLARACDRHAAALGRRFTAITLRDTRSRWGSCTHDGRLMFSWRLAMAPAAVLDYVAAHEVAHLAHMDHSPAFWAAVGRLMPDYAERRAWLRQHGGGLQSWRFRAPTPASAPAQG